MKERPILFSAPMINAILAGRKSQTRRIVKTQPSLVYGVADDLIKCYHSSDDTGIWSYAEADPRFAERGLHGRGRWEYLLTNQICRVWEEGFRGLVCVEGAHKSEGVQKCFLVPREREGNGQCPSFGLHGIPRDASDAEPSNASFRRGFIEQHPIELGMGDANPELGGSESSQQTIQQRDLQIHTGREAAYPMVDFARTLQPTPSGADTGSVTKLRVVNSKYSVGQRLWVRESHAIFCVSELQAGVGYKADHPYGGDLSKTDGGYNFYSLEPEQVADAQRMVNPNKWRPSIHMPRWASRITLEITGVRVERLQEITPRDILDEGIQLGTTTSDFTDKLTPAFQKLWESINGEGSWDKNPFVWVVAFKRV